MPRDLLEKAKNYAVENDTTLTSLIEAFLRRIPDSHISQDYPIVQRLSGILSDDLTLQDYKEHLVQKYGQ